MFDLSGALYAMGTSTSGSGGGGGVSWEILVPFTLMFAVLYFVLIRPEKKKEKERKLQLASIRQGDRVLTIGGIYGVIHAIKDDDTIVLKIAEGTKIECTRASIQVKLS
ncbi:MAG: preprotein translocase subunit YajC [Leptospirales bacterium]|nr:preprotein translocase subunit YajC [Leptospirales bacterium]